MNYYRRFPGDYSRDTGHLTLAEHGAYTLLLDAYYSTEKPLPAHENGSISSQKLYRICRAFRSKDRSAVDSVLRQFWTLTDEGWINERAKKEIENQQPRLDAARNNGRRGGRPPKTQSVFSGLADQNPDETQAESYPDPTPLSKANALDRSFAQWYGRYPRKTGKTKARSAWQKLTQADRDAALAALDSWPFPADLNFCPHPATWLNGRRWEDEPIPPAPRTTNGRSGYETPHDRIRRLNGGQRPAARHDAGEASEGHGTTLDADELGLRR